MKRAPWSRIRRQNSVDKEFLEIVGKRKLTGSVWKETIAVSVTIWISVQNRHSRILLRVLSCGRMREMLRKPEIQRQESQWKNGSIALQGSPQRNVHQFILWKMAPSRVLFLQDRENGCRFGKSTLMRIARLMDSLAKGLERMVTKVQWLCWKLHDNWVVYLKIRSRQILHRSCGRAQTYETNPMCSIHRSRRTSC